jgi:hypothetical protein
MRQGARSAYARHGRTGRRRETVERLERIVTPLLMG